MQIIDTAEIVTPHLEWLKSQGCQTVIRYLTTGGGDKLVSPAEAHAIGRAGMNLGLVFEVWGGSGRTNFQHGDITDVDGARHGEFARLYAPKVGAPDGAVIWFAVDTDVDEVGYVRHVGPYLAAVRHALGGKYHIGLYSNGLACERALNEGAADAAWLAQSTGWAGFYSFRLGKRWALLQGPSVVKHALDYDTDVAGEGLDPGAFGAFPPFGEAVAAPPEAPPATPPTSPATPTAPPVTPAPVASLLAQVAVLAGRSPAARVSWQGQGVAPAGFTKGMAAAYALAYLRLKAGAPAETFMAKATVGRSGDVLAWYGGTFNRLGMPVNKDGVDTFRAVATLMFGLAIRESSGNFGEGRDTGSSNFSADNVEAGLFQVSWDIPKDPGGVMAGLFAERAAMAQTGNLDVERLGPIFHEGVTITAAQWRVWGHGTGADFQLYTKAAPMFAFEVAGCGLRIAGGRVGHWGPIRREIVQVLPAVYAMLKNVEALVDGTPLGADAPAGSRPVGDDMVMP